MIDAHVAALGQVLRGPGAVRRSMLREVRDGLCDAAEAYVDQGVERGAAAQRAVAEFGTVEELATEYQAELTAQQGRASALLVMLAFPATALGWELMWRSGVTWTPGPDTTTSALVSTLAWWEGVIALATAAVAALLLAHTYLRRVRPRRITALIGITAGVGALAEAALTIAMTVLNGRTDLAHLGENPTALPAYLISGLVLVVVLTAAARSVRTARTRPPTPGPASPPHPGSPAGREPQPRLTHGTSPVVAAVDVRTTSPMTDHRHSPGR